MKKAYLEAGEFVTTHGIGGELRLYPWSDSPAFLAGFERLYSSPTGGKPLEVAQIRPHKNICIVKLAGVDTIVDARPYIGKTVWIARADADLPEGRFFVQDLLGARVQDADTGEVYGNIATITHPGRHDVYEIQRPGGGMSLFPAVEPFLVKVNTESGEVWIRPIEGMFAPDEAGEQPPEEKL